jgi:5'-methylthioadenosine phosphorylase
MTNVPQAFLAREALMAYATAGLVTDSDSWLDDPAQHISVGAIFERYGQTLSMARQVPDELMRRPLPEPEPASRQALAGAVLIPDEALSADQKAWLSVLRA